MSSVFRYIFGLLMLFPLLLVGVYFYVFGWSGGVKLASRWLTDYSREEKAEFVSYLTPHSKQADLNGEAKQIFVVVGVVIDIDWNNGVVGMLSMNGYKRYKEDTAGLSLYKYVPSCRESSDSDPIFDDSFGEWLSRVRRGDYVEVVYLGENESKGVIPFLQMGYYESVPVGSDDSKLCLR